MCKDDETGFISSQDITRFSLNPDVLISQCRFNAQFYEDSLFRRYGVEYSSTLDNAVIKRKSEFLAGRYAAKQALSYFGAASCAVGIGRDRSPVWPKGVAGSISHTNTRAVCAVTSSKDYQAIGIDLENWMSYSRAHSIKCSIVSEKEERYLKQLSVPLETSLTIIFSAKESLFKALYPQVGRYFGFDAAEVISIDLPKNELKLALTTELTADLIKGEIFKGNVIAGKDTVFTGFSLPDVSVG